MDHNDSDSDGSPPPVQAPRSKPNILVTGTPGTGKTTTCELIGISTGLEHIEVGKLVKEKKLHQGWDEQFQSWLIDEDQVVDELEARMQRGGTVVDHHGCDFFPERWFDLVVVLRADNSTLYPRLEGRNYSERKIQENIECEIMQVVLEEARESYKEGIVWELPSQSIQDMEDNAQKISDWVESFTGNIGR
ncbi:AAA domain-containing protein [Phlyctochytrium arcticum]|nr:AAA domain-containing protein [Phlyctochytrium arcticum]